LHPLGTHRIEAQSGNLEARRSEGYESGTVYEYETALALSRKNNGIPSLYLFRKSAPILYRAESAAEDMEQHELLETVWKRWTQSGDGYNSSAFKTFAQTEEFERQIEDCLRRWLEERGILVSGPVWDRRIRGSPFRGLAPFEPSHSASFSAAMLQRPGSPRSYAPRAFCS